MWFGKRTIELIEALRRDNISLQSSLSYQAGQNDKLKTENERMRADLDWFKLRLNAVEKERAQLIHAAIGVKISVPEFLPVTPDPVSQMHAVQERPDLSFIGGDLPDGIDPSKVLLADMAPDYSGMPARANN